jgi:hypothetical protein
MAVNKNFVVKNGLEVSDNLIFADALEGRVGVGTTAPKEHLLHVFGGIGVTDAYVTGITTIAENLQVGPGGTVLNVLAAPGIGNSVGIGNSTPEYLLDVRAPVSTGQTAFYVRGDARITGDLYIRDDLTIDELSARNIDVSSQTSINFLSVIGVSTFASNIDANHDLNVIGISTFESNVDINDDLDVDGRTELDTTNISETLNVVGISTFASNVDINSELDVEDDAVFGGDIRIRDEGTTNIFLMNDGAATFSRDVQVGAGFVNGGGCNLFVSSSGSSDEHGAFVAKGLATMGSSAKQSAAFMVNDGIGTPAAIFYDGSATFAGGLLSIDVAGAINTSSGLVAQNKSGFGDSEISVIRGLNAAGTHTSEIFADGSATFAGIGSFGSDLYIGGNLNVVGDVLYDEVNGRNLNISGISTTQNLEVLNHTSLNTLNVSGVSTFANNIFCNGDISLPDHTRIALGDNNDLQIRHSGSHSIISDTGTGNLNINASRLLVFDSTAVEYLASFTENGPVELYYDSFKKFETTATGIDVTGHIETDTLNVSGISTTQNLEVSDHTSLNTLNVSGVSTFTSNIFVGTGATVGFGSTAFFRDNAKAIFGNGGDLAIHHGGGPSGEASYIDESGTGKLYIRSNSLSVKGITADEPIASFIEDGSVELFYDATKRFETTSDGIDVTGHIETDTLNVSGISTFNSTVNVKTSLRLNGPNDQTDLYIGSSNQVKLDHNGSSAFWINEIGSSYIRGAAGFIVQKEGDGYDDIIKGIADGAVELYYDNVKKFETTSDGIDVTGHIETDTLNVSGGSSLTNQLEIRSDDATPARIDFYCEVNNLHRVRLKSPLHSEFSGNPDVVLPNISGNLLVGDTASPISQDLNTTGVITAQDFDALSDINFKENIQTVDNALNKVMSLRGVSFDWKKSKQPSFGVIAQEIEEVFPDLVHGESPKTVNYNGLVSVLIESIKDMKREITSLNEEVQSLKKSIMN